MTHSHSLYPSTPPAPPALTQEVIPWAISNPFHLLCGPNYRITGLGEMLPRWVMLEPLSPPHILIVVYHRIRKHDHFAVRCADHICEHMGTDWVGVCGACLQSLVILSVCIHSFHLLAGSCWRIKPGETSVNRYWWVLGGVRLSWYKLTVSSPVYTHSPPPPKKKKKKRQERLWWKSVLYKTRNTLIPASVVGKVQVHFLPDNTVHSTVHIKRIY